MCDRTVSTSLRKRKKKSAQTQCMREKRRALRDPKGGKFEEEKKMAGSPAVDPAFGPEAQLEEAPARV